MWNLTNDQWLWCRYVKEQCPQCNNVPEQPALCLLCGALCCAVSQRLCCRLLHHLVAITSVLPVQRHSQRVYGLFGHQSIIITRNCMAHKNQNWVLDWWLVSCIYWTDVLPELLAYDLVVLSFHCSKLVKTWPLLVELFDVRFSACLCFASVHILDKKLTCWRFCCSPAQCKWTRWMLQACYDMWGRHWCILDVRGMPCFSVFAHAMLERNCGISDGAQLMCKSHQLLIGQDLGQHDCWVVLSWTVNCSKISLMDFLVVSISKSDASVARTKPECLRILWLSNTALPLETLCDIVWQRTDILLQRCERQTLWPSPYLDAFGEEVTAAMDPDN